MGKTKDFIAFEWGMVVDARRTVLSVSRTAPLLGFSHCIKYWPPPKGHPANLTQLW
jgi:hypothetical protein